MTAQRYETSAFSRPEAISYADKHGLEIHPQAMRQARHDAKLIVGSTGYGLNPKVENMAALYPQRRHDVIVISAQRFRTQEHNKRDAFERLAEMVAQARIEPRVRKATKPTRASKERRLQGKQQRSEVKKGRKVTHDW